MNIKNSVFTRPFPNCLLLCLFILMAWAARQTVQAAAPSLLLPPTTASVDANDNDDQSADFLFDQAMDRSATDVTWAGAGFDASKVRYKWTPEVVFGFDNALFLECTYEGGWPPGIVVTWTLNKGNSGVIKSKAGQALLERTGTFTTPGTASGGTVTITPSATDVTVGGILTFQFSAAMNTSIPANSIFQVSTGQWQKVWESATVLKCTLTGGVAAGSTVEATYTLTGLRTATGNNVADFLGEVTLHGTDPVGPGAPTLSAGPTTDGISAFQGKAVFVFSEPMNSTGLDIQWSGTGIDPTKITSTWLVTTIFNKTLPVTTIEATYQGGWPRSVLVTYKLNPGNSGVIKSATGVALAETTGSFMTPASGPGTNPGGIDVENCVPSTPGNEAGGSLSLLKEINYFQSDANDPVFDAVRKATVIGGAITSSSNTPPAIVTSASLNRPVGGSVALVKVSVPNFPNVPPLNIPDTFFLSTTPAPEITPPTFNSLAELNAAYPNGNYSMAVTLSGGGGSRTVSLPINPTPEQPAPKIGNYAALQNFNPAQPLTIQWNSFGPAGQLDSIQLTLIERGGNTAYIAPNICANIVLNVTDTSHTIPAGTLRANVTYDVELSFHKTTHVRDADNSATPQPNHIRGYAEFTLLTKTTRLVIGAPPAVSDLRFTRAFLSEENGFFAMEVSGSLASASAFAQIEGSQDFATWTTTGISITKAGLEALGGKIVVQDPSVLTNPLPYRFYRIVIP